jgi:acyl carrier protein
MIETFRKLVDEHGRMPVPAASLEPDQDLYAAGLTSFATVQLMLAIEEAFDIEFPERMLNRRSFASLRRSLPALTKSNRRGLPRDRLRQSRG